MNYIITGASGRVARETIDFLLAKGVAASDLILISRSPKRMEALSSQGARVRPGDFIMDPDSLPGSFEGGDAIFIIPLSHPPDWVDEAKVKTHVVRVAAEAGVRHAVYLSSIHADATPLHADDLAVEEALKASGMTWTILRTATFAESIGRESKRYLQEGRIVTNAGAGRFGVATREDPAAAAAEALTGGEHVRNRTFNIVSQGVTYGEVAQVPSEIGGRHIEVVELDDAAMAERIGSPGRSLGGQDRPSRVARPYQTPPAAPPAALTGRRGDSLFDLLRANAQELLTGEPPEGQEMQFAFLWQARGEPRPYT
jgi:NAD(P)H dehydrogenase (quinone)